MADDQLSGQSQEDADLQGATVEQAAPSFSPRPRRLGLGILLFGTAAIVVVAGAGATLGYMFDVWPFSKKASEAEQIANLAKTIGDISSATYDISINVRSGPRDEGAKPLVLSAPEATSNEGGEYGPGPTQPALFNPITSDMLFAYVPADLNITVKAGGATQIKNDSQATLDARFGFGADIQLSDFTINADLEFLKKGEVVYGIIRKFPGILFFDPTPLKNKWVQMPLNEIGSALPFASVDVEKTREKQDIFLKQLVRMYAHAQETGVMTFIPGQNPDAAMPDSIKYYTATYAREKLPDYYKTLSQELTTQYGSDTLMVFDQKTLDYLNGNSFTEQFNYAKENAVFAMWLDTKTGLPAQFTYTLRVIPPDSVVKLKDIQYKLTATLKLTDINKPAAIDAPAEFITLDDAQMLLSGQTKEEYYYAKQLGNVAAIRRGLDTYQMYAGSYPDSLDKLTGTYSEAQKLNPNPAPGYLASAGSYYDTAKIMPVVPTDPFTKKPYPYENKGGDYSLTYTIERPPATTQPKSLIYDPNAYANVISGINTATSKVLSVEGEADSDKDGITDGAEQKCGTDIQKADTDGDGFSDREEIIGGYNPAGFGKLSAERLRDCGASPQAGALTPLSSFETRGRDARRIADLRSIQNSLELYFTKRSTYPTGPAYANMVTQITGADIGINNIPNDPLTGRSYTYAPGNCTGEVCLNYIVGASLEISDHEALNNDVDKTVFGINCADPIYCVEF
jgi:hypothetical protein